MKKKIEKFEDLIARQKARKLTCEVYKVSGRGKFGLDYGLKDQVRRAAVSSMSNTAEGFERGSLAESHRFLTIAKGSCVELRTQLYVALDFVYLDEASFHPLMTQAIEVGKILGGLRASVQQKRRRSLVRKPTI